MSAGLARFAADLPSVREFVSLGEGDTPLLSLDALANRLGVQVSAKMESLNPTGSYKDRVAAMSLSLARERGHRGWIATSSGNAGMAFAAYGARARLPGFLCVVSTAPAEKLRPLAPYGTALVRVDGVGDSSTAQSGPDLMERVRNAAEQHGLFLGITANAFNPDGMRGIDTLSYEFAEQCPDASHVYVPTGGGGLISSVARGLAHRGHPAKIVACQPAGCAPIARCLSGELALPVVEHVKTGISALQLPAPPDGELALGSVRGSDGWGVMVSDDEALSAQRLLAETEGVFVEPAAAVGPASLIRDVKDGRVGVSDHPVLVLTGAGWKDLGRFATEADQTPVVPVESVSEQIDAWAHTI